ncbi:MAG: hypothetical protein GTN46_03400 [Gammaproteobacteria bacterium]|nr:hypothetical protein [Gammaproteobacteria bacterium]NIN61371.1 hypothetical protein [Gammaproteobacteria bacterium]NIO61138.1 hypothetical protein [Gammaproteobacteria bacterium]NIQ19140.1 hypothetical protein [Gammaproteobacteria bacterium]NIQ75736.1 hypothetical protein [Gammaproteobacteria bacterium]
MHDTFLRHIARGLRPGEKIIEETGRYYPDEVCVKQREHISIQVNQRQTGFSTMEMVLTVSVVLLMFSLVIPAAREIVNKTRSDNVVVDLEKIQSDINDFITINRRLPDSLAEIYADIPRDPWGNKFKYLNIADSDESIKFKVRKYKFIKNLNSDYDLFSVGIDGESVQPLIGKSSRDDIVRAKNGLFIGPAEELIKSINE